MYIPAPLKNLAKSSSEYSCMQSVESSYFHKLIIKKREPTDDIYYLATTTASLGNREGRTSEA